MSNLLLYRFNTILDSSKTGLRLKPGIYESDQKLFGGEVPTTSEDALESEKKPFIFHALHAAGKAAADKLLVDYDDIPGEGADAKDADLKRPYTIAAEHALRVYQSSKSRILTDEMARIRDPVDNAYQAYCNALDQANREEAKRFSKKKPKKKGSDPMLLAAHLYAEEVTEVILIQNVKEIKASYAYHCSPAFAFSVAFQDLCLIKAQAAPGGVAPSIRSFDEAKSIPSTYTRAMARLTTDRPWFL